MSLTREQQSALLEDIALAIGDGLAAAQICEELSQHANQHRLVNENHAIQAMQSALYQGQPMATAMAPWFDNDLCMLVSVGERSGLLTELLVAQQRFEQQRRAALVAFWRPLVYPLIMLLLSLFACLAVGQWVLPKLASGIDALYWPLLAQHLMVMSSPWVLVGIVSILGGLLLLFWGPYPLIDFRRPLWLMCAKHGAFVIRRYFDGVLLLQTLTVLLGAGVRLDRALHAMQEFGQGSLSYCLPQLRQLLLQGERRLAVILDCGLLSPRMLFRLQNGSRNATEHGTLQRVAGYAANDAIAALARLRVLMQVSCYLLILWLLLLTVGGMGSMLMAVTQQHVR